MLKTPLTIPDAKRKVQYIGDVRTQPFFKNGKLVGICAILTPMDHPDARRVSNDQAVLTSAIVHWNHDTDVIETQNTIYTPIKVPMPAGYDANGSPVA